MFGNLIVRVAFDCLYAVRRAHVCVRRQLSAVRRQRGYNAHVIRRAVAVSIEEYQIAYGRGPRLRGAPRLHGRHALQVFHPFGAARFRRIFHVRIVQTEGREHSAPVSVFVAVPLAVARVALGHFRAVHRLYFIVIGALRVAQLGLGDRHDVLPGFPAQLHLGECLFPIRRSL